MSNFCIIQETWIGPIKAVLSFIAVEIFADVHQAVFASARPSQHLES